MASLSGWQYRKKLTIDKTKVDADLTDFPVTVILTSSNFNFSKARSDGYDIRFTSSDGTTLLKYERERHDSSNQVAEYHVKIPSVSGSSNTDFYIYYGKSDASDGADSTNVWDSYFKGVWHLKDYTTSQVNDSTSNANNGTKKAANEPLEVNAKIGKGQQFDGVNDYINCGNNSSLNIITFTIECWIKYNSLSNAQVHITKGVASSGQNWHIIWRPEVPDVDATIYGSTSKAIFHTNPSTGVWYYYVATYQDTGSSTIITAFLNGVQTSQVTSSLRLSNVSGDNFYMGQLGSGNWTNGIIDEVRISSVARSAAWIKASYNSGNDTLLSYGSEELLPTFFLFFN